MRFITLFPENKPAGHRPEMLDNRDEPGGATHQVRSRVLLTKAEDELLRVTTWIYGIGYVVTILSAVGDLVALATAMRDIDARKAAVKTAAFKGYEIIEDHFRTLFTPADYAFNAERRSARLIDDDETFQVSSKLVVPEAGDNFDEPMSQLRIWIAGFGWVELVLNDVGDVVAHTVAATEKDAWKAALAVMRRKGYIADRVAA